MSSGVTEFLEIFPSFRIHELLVVLRKYVHHHFLLHLPLRHTLRDCLEKPLLGYTPD